MFSDLTGGEREGVFEVAVAQLNMLRPEIIVNVGDLIDGSTERAKLDEQWDSFDARANRASAPIFYTGGNHLNAVRWGRWKLHLHEDLLFDLESDVRESKNIFEQHPDVVERLRRYADICRADLGDARLGIEGKNCRPAGRVENAVTLTVPDPDDPLVRAAYD